MSHSNASIKDFTIALPSAHGRRGGGDWRSSGECRARGCNPRGPAHGPWTGLRKKGESAKSSPASTPCHGHVMLVTVMSESSCLLGWNRGLCHALPARAMWADLHGRAEQGREQYRESHRPPHRFQCSRQNPARFQMPGQFESARCICFTRLLCNIMSSHHSSQVPPARTLQKRVRSARSEPRTRRKIGATFVPLSKPPQERWGGVAVGVEWWNHGLHRFEGSSSGCRWAARPRGRWWVVASGAVTLLRQPNPAASKSDPSRFPAACTCSSCRGHPNYQASPMVPLRDRGRLPHGGSSGRQSLQVRMPRRCRPCCLPFLPPHARLGDS